MIARPRPMMNVKDVLRRNVPLSALLAWRRLKARDLVDGWARRDCFAEVPVDLRKIRLFRRESFPESGPVPWLDRDGALERIAEKLAAGEITDVEAALCRRWSRDGYVLLEGFFDPDFVDGTWAAVEEAVASGKLPVPFEAMTEDEPYEGRFQDLHQRVPEVGEILRHPGILDLIRLLFGREVHPFQTIAFFAGSQQPEHSDAAHMTTYPQGYLVGTWAAMEDIHPDSGPLVYYPGSHRLPYYSAGDVGIEPRESVLDFYGAYSGKYEPFIQQVIRRQGCEPVVFTPRKGDVLVWHANLLHGGTARRDPARSRKSVVCHYFARGAICYHDISAGLARLD